MATSNVLSLQYAIDGNSNYPFTDASTFLSSSGKVINKAMFIDANIYTLGGSARQFISKITVAGSSLTVTVSDASGELCSGTIALGSSSRQILMYDSYARNVGLILGNADAGEFFGALPPGEYSFAPNSLEFVSTCVSPQPITNVQGIVLADGSVLTGDVWLVGKNGVYLEWDSVKETIRVHLVGDPLFAKRNCDTEAKPFENPTPLQALTFITDAQTSVTIKPDQYGNIRFTTGPNQSSDNALRIEQTQYGLLIKALGTID